MIKLVREEEHSRELAEWLDARPQAELVSSALVEVEVSRALHRSMPQALPRVPTTLAKLYRLSIGPVVRATAAAYPDQRLRSLDAIHVATAQILADDQAANLEAFVSYDKRLLASAAAAGLPTASPGAD